MIFRRLGTYSSRVSMTVSPKSSRRSGQVPLRRVYGAYWTNMDMICFPGGATLGSRVEGMQTSMKGRREKSPHVIRRQVPRFDKRQERPLRIRIRDDDPGTDRLAVRQLHAVGPPVLHENTPHVRARPDLHAIRASRPGNGLADHARPATDEPPGTVGALDLPPEVVEEHPGRARGARAQEGSGD